MKIKPRKVLVLGSGALKIGQAGEFDYSGSQAIKALKEEGIYTVLINPNIATIQTSEFLADQVYFLPVTSHFVAQVIEREKPDGILLSFGGQTALNCGIELHKSKVLEKNNLKVLGTPVDTIILTEDRQKFANHLKKIKVPTPQSHAATTIQQAKSYAREVGYPVMVRAAYTLGGQKSGVATDEHELKKLLDDTFSFSKQALIEKYLHHFKEIEYEVVRDSDDNCVTVCNMENMDPLGIHTGESIVVAPSQTLNNSEYQLLRRVSINIVRSLGIVGECNVQFALNPKPKKAGEIEFYVIEVNARLSRSSALASKATGYPLAYVAAKLGLGQNLTEVKNQVTKTTQSAFEPALDYVVVKIPRWDLEKFKGVDRQIGSSMKSVGEVMGIGRTFEEALQKAIRMLDWNLEGATENIFPKDKGAFMRYIKVPTRKRVFAFAHALRLGFSIQYLYRTTGVDPWFLYRIQNIVNLESALKKNKEINKQTLLELKQNGFSDRRIGFIAGQTEDEIRTTRKKLGVYPSVFQIDTLAGEVPAVTNYLYMTYNGNHHDVSPLGKKGVVVLGSGTYRIGSSVEFDWTCVNAAIALKKHKKSSIIINCNPETVSTDYDISDRLYFEELTHERVLDIWEFEESLGMILSVGGQTPNNLAKSLDHDGVVILGTTAENIDRAEDRDKFSTLLDTLSIKQPEWNKFASLVQAKEFAARVGYPVIIRPSYVLSGAAMALCFTEDEFVEYIQKAVLVGRDNPITVSKFMAEAKEIELDGVAQKGRIMVSAISEHIEHAGVHSGDATISYPSQRIYLETEKQINKMAVKISKALSITGPFNIQFLAKAGMAYVIEINVRASRTFPFISKATGVNFAYSIVDSFFGKAKQISLEYPDSILVKVPQFSFARLEGADPVLQIEMASTGEAACFGDTIEEAFLKGIMSVDEKLPSRGIFLSLGGLENKVKFINTIYRLRDLGIQLYATAGTAEFLKQNGVAVKRLYKIHENKTPNTLTAFQKGIVDLAINITDPYYKKDINDDYVIRRAAVDHNIHLLTNRQKAALFIKSLSTLTLEDLKVKPWREYVARKK